MMLYEAQETLGDDADDEAAEVALEQVRRQLHLQLSDSGSFYDEKTRKWDKEMEGFISLVRDTFEEMDLPVREYSNSWNVFVFEGEIRKNGNPILMRTCLDQEEHVCYIFAVYPFTASPVLFYPLCAKLVEENYNKPFGTLHYNAEDGEISCRYGFRMNDDFRKEDFRKVFLEVAQSAGDSYGAVKQYASGIFRRAERNHIICAAQKLLIALAPMI